MAIQIHPQKLERQLIGIERWRVGKNLGISHSNGCGTWHWVTGMGKTFAACIVANKLLDVNNASTIYVIVPGEDLEKQWNQEIKNFVKQEHLNNFIVITVHKAVNLQYKPSCTFVIFDEVHEYLTDDRLGLINGDLIDAKYKLGLTATWIDKSGRHKKIEHLLPVVDVIEEEEAIREGWVSKYIEYNLGVALTHSELNAYKEHSETIHKNLNKFNRNLGWATKCLVGEKSTGKKGIDFCFVLAAHNGFKTGMDLTNETNQKIYDLWHPKKIMGYAANLMEAVKIRKDILYNAQNKLITAKELVKKFNTLKTIMFSQSTHFADQLGAIINQEYHRDFNTTKDICVVFHSKLATRVVFDEVKNKQVKKGKVKLKREAIDAIRTGKVRIISTASSLDRGFDVKDIRLGITTSSTQNPTQGKQRKGRVIRVEDTEKDVIVLIINIYIKGTKDEEWLRNRQAKDKNIVYWVDSIDDINYTPREKGTFNIEDF